MVPDPPRHHSREGVLPLRVGDVTEQREAVFAAANHIRESLRRLAAVAEEAFAPVHAELVRTGETLRRASVRAAQSGVARATVTGDFRDIRMQRALEARRGRNTGPAVPPPGARMGRRNR